MRPIAHLATSATGMALGLAGDVIAPVGATVPSVVLPTIFASRTASTAWKTSMRRSPASTGTEFGNNMGKAAHGAQHEIDRVPGRQGNVSAGRGTVEFGGRVRLATEPAGIRTLMTYRGFGAEPAGSRGLELSAAGPKPEYPEAGREAGPNIGDTAAGGEGAAARSFPVGTGKRSAQVPRRDRAIPGADIGAQPGRWTDALHRRAGGGTAR